MAKGQYLRTNYRATGGITDITAIGGGVPLASIHGGAGTDLPYGGFMLVSLAQTVQQATADASLAGISSRWVESTYGLMSAFYGSTKYDSGYVFQPMVIYFMSVTGVVMSAGQPDDSVLGPIAVSLRTSGSIAAFTPLLPFLGTASTTTFVSLSGATIEFQMAGFIISGP